MRGVAVCLHGYQRNTVDLDLLVRHEDQQRVRDALTAGGLTWSTEAHEDRTDSGVGVQLLLSGDRAGPGESVALPDPTASDAIVDRQGLPVVALARLIEIKIACGSGNLRRTHKDFADVVELIAANQLDQSFAQFLDKSVRRTFRELVGRAQA
ncbi:MAG TPA: hypothetical protein VG713_11730 [Pirellulales bacterium]|nr:hypothetical protein [Pirellulales bacterium]